MSDGILLVIEGIDGSGKSTQLALARKALGGLGREVRTIAFPRYKEESSALVRLYLSGAFGSRPEDVNAYAASTFFAVDRFAGYKEEWGAYYHGGGAVLADRYTTSNAIHQASKLPESEWAAFMGWLDEFEYDRLALPRPTVTVWLDMPVEQSVANMRRREAETHTAADIHEVDEDYLRRCHRAAAFAAEFYGWQRISCVDESGALRSPKDIHGEIMSRLADALG